VIFEDLKKMALKNYYEAFRSLIAVAVALGFSAVAIAAALTGEVVGVADGDTIKILDAGKVQHVVRLSGIDAPEKGMPFSQLSRHHLSDQVYGRWVEVEGAKSDRYGRLVGKVLLDGRDVNLAQVKAGLAWHYKQYEREQSAFDRHAYAEAEMKASTAKQGLWQDRHAIEPWEWRKARRNKDSN
jgi:endonuclease YncB( thermonuclease family)